MSETAHTKALVRSAVSESQMCLEHGEGNLLWPG